MKKLLCLALLLLAAPVWAATYSVTTTAGQETVITRARIEDNAKACASIGLAVGCTQAQADAQSPGKVTIYSANGPWLLDVLKAAVAQRLGDQQTADLAAWEKARGTATRAQKDAACTALGLPAGCLP